MKTSNFSITLHKVNLSILLALSLTGCASMVDPDKPLEVQPISAGSSFLKQDTDVEVKNETAPQQEGSVSSQFTRLNSNTNQSSAKLEVDLSKRFGDNKLFQVSANDLPLNDFLHYVLGELLEVSYLIEPSVKNNTSPVTLELKEKVSAQRLFQLLQQVLSQNKVSIRLNDEIFYLYPAPKREEKSNKAFGFGRTLESVPEVSSTITQLIPLRYKINKSLINTLGSLLKARVTIDAEQSLASISGSREEVLRSIALIDILDSPLLHNKATALLSFAYIDTYSFIEKVSELLEQDGISSNLADGKGGGGVNFIPLEHLGKVVVFASDDAILDRIEYWSKLIDKPATGSEQSYYVYHPRYARAADLGQSLAPLLASSSNSSAPFNQGRGANNTGINNNSAGSSIDRIASKGTSNEQSTQAVEGDNLRMVVDDRANALIFYSTGKHYQELQPIIRQLDIMPKQVMLEVVIAEVKLTGSFSKGVEYAIKNGEAGNNQSTFSFGGESGFNYSIVGLAGNFAVNLNQTDGLINVLSRPTIVVRDGVSASISVGDDIPTIGSTTTDPISGDRQTTNIVYRKTGVDLSVTPTINAQGTIIMSIQQNISNVSASGPSIGGSTAVFERTLSTEVVAGDGQTVMLGGLISESKNNGATSVPILGSLPVIGHLFRTDTEETDKTELVILVTPRIISNDSDWQMVKDSFAKGLENIQF